MSWSLVIRYTAIFFTHNIICVDTNLAMFFSPLQNPVIFFLFLIRYISVQLCFSSQLSWHKIVISSHAELETCVCVCVWRDVPPYFWSINTWRFVQTVKACDQDRRNEWRKEREEHRMKTAFFHLTFDIKKSLFICSGCVHGCYVIFNIFILVPNKSKKT